MPHPLPDKGALRALLDYDPETGLLKWKARSGKAHVVAAHNARFAGKVAGSVAPRNRGAYLVVEIDGSPRYAHRIAYKWMTGEEPAMIDHRNGDGLDNRFENLRAASDHDNQGNRRMRLNTRTGEKCVRQIPSGSFCAHITKRGLYVHLGTFPTAAEAKAAYATAAQEYFGDFARSQ